MLAYPMQTLKQRNSDHGSATVEWYVDKRVAALWFLFLFNGA